MNVGPVTCLGAGSFPFPEASPATYEPGCTTAWPPWPSRGAPHLGCPPTGIGRQPGRPHPRCCSAATRARALGSPRLAYAPRGDTTPYSRSRETRFSPPHPCTPPRPALGTGRAGNSRSTFFRRAPSRALRLPLDWRFSRPGSRLPSLGTCPRKSWALRPPPLRQPRNGRVGGGSLPSLAGNPKSARWPPVGKTALARPTL